MDRTDDPGAVDVKGVVDASARLVLGDDDADSSQSFLAQGGNSLTAVALAMTVGDQLGIEVPLELIFDSANLDDLAQQLAARIPEPAGGPTGPGTESGNPPGSGTGTGPGPA